MITGILSLPEEASGSPKMPVLIACSTVPKSPCRGCGGAYNSLHAFHTSGCWCGSASLPSHVRVAPLRSHAAGLSGKTLHRRCSVEPRNTSEARRYTHRTSHRPTATRPASMCRRMQCSPRYARASPTRPPTAFTQRSGGARPWQLLNATVRPLVLVAAPTLPIVIISLLNYCVGLRAHELYTHASALCDAHSSRSSLHSNRSRRRHARSSQLSAPPSF